MKILVFMKNWLGDVLFQLPAIELIKIRYPESEIFCIAPERCREILEAHPAVSGFIPFDEKTTHRPLFSKWGFIRQLRKTGPWEEGYLFHRSKTRAMIFFWAGVKKRIGYAKRRSLFLTQAVPEPFESLHHVDYVMALMHAAGFQVPQKPQYRFYYKQEDQKIALSLLAEHGLQKKGSFVCFHLGANWEVKRWPMEHFSILAEQIHAHWRLPIVVTGSKQDQPLFDGFAKKIQAAQVISLIGQTSLGVSGAIYEQAACLVTGDSGPMHLAAGVGTPVVALFGPTDPKLTGPRGSGDQVVLQYIPEGYKVPWYGKKLPPEGWLSHITPEQVLRAMVEKAWLEHT